MAERSQKWSQFIINKFNNNFLCDVKSFPPRARMKNCASFIIRIIFGATPTWVVAAESKKFKLTRRMKGAIFYHFSQPKPKLASTFFRLHFCTLFDIFFPPPLSLWVRFSPFSAPFHLRKQELYQLQFTRELISHPRLHLYPALSAFLDEKATLVCRLAL